MGTPALATRHVSNLPLENLRATDISPHSHVVQFYTSHQKLLDGLWSFVRSSLRAGDSIVIVATDAHRRDLQLRLKNARLNLDVVGEGRLQMLDAHKTLDSFLVRGTPDWRAFQRTMKPIFDKARAASNSNFRDIAAFGEMVGMLAREKRFDAAIKLERFWNQFARTTRLVLHCAYPMHLFAEPYCDEHYLRICREHTNVVPA